jgi:tRNA 2-thiouridine synthesizing protein A
VSVDALGLQCPLPVFHARDALFDMAPGELLEVLADDPQAPSDFETWCPKNGHKLRSIESRGLTFRILIEKGPQR